jgi:hypothetical protein
MPSKYKNIPTAVDGIIFHSKKEAGRYGELKLLERAGYITNLQLQKPFDLIVNGVYLGKYISDFAYLDQQGREVIEDVKGVKTAVYRLKAKLMVAVHGVRVTEI